MTPTPGPVDLEYFEQHYAIKHLELSEHMWQVVEHLHATCPVAHSDAPTEAGGAARGMWVVTKYEDVFRVLQDWDTFSSDCERLVEAGTYAARLGNLPPMTVDPPVQRDFRHLLNPFLSPQAVAPYEPQIRHLAAELIDRFIEDGRFDVVAQLAGPLPPRVLYSVVFGIDDDGELQRSLELMEPLAKAADAAGYARAMANWVAWIRQFVEARRAAPRRDDIIDALLHGTVDGHPLTDEEVLGAIRILIMGGFFTTNDAISSTMLVLAQHLEIQAQLRSIPGLIPTLLDEVLRLEPPVISLFRVCTRDVELRGQQLRAGDAVLVHFGGANRDAEEFDGPAEVRTDRTRNRHLSFGSGPHRCIGSNLARLELRVVFEEVIARMHDIRLTDSDVPRRSEASFGRGFDYLPVSFTPGSRSAR